MSRKAEIILAAQDLFNQKGLEQVSLKVLANHIGISDGNLRYHFQKKKDLILAIFQQMCGKIEDLVSDQRIEDLGIGMILQANKDMFEIFYEYRFLMLNLSSIVRNPDLSIIRDYLRDILKQRRKEFLVIFYYMVGQGYMLPEPEEGLYEKLIHLCFLVSDHWMSDAAIYHTDDINGQLSHYLELLVLPILPYLTEEGKKAYADSWEQIMRND